MAYVRLGVGFRLAMRAEAVRNVAAATTDDEDQPAPKALLRAGNQLLLTAVRAAARRAAPCLTGAEYLGTVGAAEIVERDVHVAPLSGMPRIASVAAGRFVRTPTRRLTARLGNRVQACGVRLLTRSRTTAARRFPGRDAGPSDANDACFSETGAAPACIRCPQLETVPSLAVQARCLGCGWLGPRTKPDSETTRPWACLTWPASEVCPLGGSTSLWRAS